MNASATESELRCQSIAPRTGYEFQRRLDQYLTESKPIVQQIIRLETMYKQPFVFCSVAGFETQWTNKAAEALHGNFVAILQMLQRKILGCTLE